MRNLRLGGKLDLHRRGLGLSVEEFAKKCRVPSKTLEGICLRQKDPSTKTLLCILKYGKVSLDLVDPEDVGEEGLV